MTKILVDSAEVYDADEAALLMGIGIATLWRWKKANKLICINLSRRTLIPKSEVERLKNLRAKEASEVAIKR